MTALFPFGAPSTPRPPRRPRNRNANAFVLGVYPSALHVRWNLPTWATEQGLGPSVAALAVDIEPTVFWGGQHPDAGELVSAWHDRWFEPGDEHGRHGYVHAPAGMNGTSGDSVETEVLLPTGRSLDDAWITDAIDTFYVKHGIGTRREQGDAIDQIYAPFAEAAGLPPCTLPARPSPSQLVTLATTEHADRLTSEWIDASADLLITLGEEARRVAAALAEWTDGPPTRPLHADDPEYGRPGRCRIAGHTATWMAVTHPGNRSAQWRDARQRWKDQTQMWMHNGI